ncbi:SAM-dependent methyltransferase [Desulfomicrobium macestii]|uniref:SAM-dependent methyltransferase n=1 Tax=Desulfomicrobium macestii TaxID=90731 RepID=A0ABR9H6R5_9BACT|nr:methyltransferase domain-containing protein [Desulfomicrobium macestii]MBE1426400.1 SAM-dependent methyltransferase [Desulfomicrobium macestii]
MMQFPPLDVLKGLADSDYDKEFMEMEFGPGLDYYLGRLDRLMFEGSSVLDAGCGMGQWGIALSRRFDTVHGVEINTPRLEKARRIANMAGARNMHFLHSSIESLPFADGSFDAVFCYGVIMFVNVGRALAEFSRVLRPGGRVYCCLNADGWSHYLADVMSREKPHIRKAGLDTLYVTYWHRAFAGGLHDSLRLLNPVMALLPFTGRPEEQTALALLTSTSQGLELVRSVQETCGEEYAARLAYDAATCVADSQHLERTLQTARAYMPAEFEALADRAGLADFQWHGEGLLVADWKIPRLEPKYPHLHDGRLSVWECTLTKPETCWAEPSTSYFIERARSAADNPAYVERSRRAVLANGNQRHMPWRLYDEAMFRARCAGDGYLEALARSLAESAPGEEGAFVSILEFVQRAVYRDPICQPVDEVGDPASPLCTLFVGRGRCGHVSRLLIELCRLAGIAGRLLQLHNHVAAEVLVDGRWVIADADAFKNGVVPRTPAGTLPTLDDVRREPWLIDRFPPTGWMTLPGDAPSRGVFGSEVRGYVDALPPERRGAVSGSYTPESGSLLPSMPRITAFGHAGGRLELAWTPSVLAGNPQDAVIGYRAVVRNRSRGWEYGRIDPALRFDEGDSQGVVLSAETGECRASFDLPEREAGSSFHAEVVPVTRRSRQYGTYLWPSREAVLQRRREDEA